MTGLLTREVLRHRRWTFWGSRCQKKGSVNPNMTNKQIEEGIAAALSR
jgi:hypothetical protein